MANASRSRRLLWLSVMSTFVLALATLAPVPADVWDDWDYLGGKRTLKVWVRNGNQAFKDAVQAAIDNWNTGDNNGSWTLEAGTEADHDVDVGTGKMDGAGGTMGRCTANDGNGDGLVEGGTSIEIDSEEDWGDGNTKQNLERAIKHELGHSQRMDDTDQDGDLMNGQQGVDDDVVEPSDHDKAEAAAAYGLELDGFDMWPESINGELLCYIMPQSGVDFDLANAVMVELTPLVPANLQIYGVQWSVSGIRAHFFPQETANHNEVVFLDITYGDLSSAHFTGLATINDVDPPEGMYPHADAGPDIYAYAGHPFTLDGSGSYHDYLTLTGPLVHVWHYPSQPNLPGGLAQTEILSMTLSPGVYYFDLDVEDMFAQHSIAYTAVIVTPYPPPGLDCFDSTMNYTLVSPKGNTYTIQLTGPTTVQRLDVGDPDGDGRRVIPTEMVQMNLSGYHPDLGPVRISLSETRPSQGRIKEQTPGNNFPADAFSDIFYVVEAFGQPPMGNCSAERLQVPGGIDELPFSPRAVFEGAPAPIQLCDQDGKPNGWWGHCNSWSASEIMDPPPYQECMDSYAELEIIAPDGTVATVLAEGPTVIRIGDMQTDRGGGVHFPTEIVSMDLKGMSPLGEITVSEAPGRASRGAVTSQQGPAGPFFPADSFFDVYIEIELPGPTLNSTVHSCEPAHMYALVDDLPPPIGTAYENPFDQIIPLLDEQGNHTGWSIRHARHVIGKLPPPQPLAATDCFESTATIGMSSSDPTFPSSLFCEGPTVIRRGDPPPDGGATVDIELVALSLKSVGPIEVTIKERPERASMGTVVPQNPEGPFFPADSFFDVFFEFTLADGTKLTNCEGIPLGAHDVSDLPFPPGTTFSTPDSAPPTQLFSEGILWGELYWLAVTLQVPCPQLTTAEQVKMADEGSAGQLEGPVVSSSFDAFFYVEDPNRSSGVRVDWPDGPMPQVSEKPPIVGNVVVVNAEVRIEGIHVEPGPLGFEIDPLHVTPRDLGGGQFGLQPPVGGGHGLNNVGLLVRTTGHVYEYYDLGRILRIHPEPTTTSDGPSLKLDFSHGAGPLIMPSLGDYIAVTGALGAEETVDGNVPVLYPVDWNKVDK